MAHLHSVYDSDKHFVVNAITREIKNVSTTKTTVIQYDHNSERFTFELPRYIEGHDMLQCNKVEVHYLNIDSSNKETKEGIYLVDDLQESPEDENILICSWLISQSATALIGSLNFLLRFACVTDDTIDYVWNTGINTNIYVSKGIFNSEIVAEQYLDLIKEWESRLEVVENSMGSGGISPTVKVTLIDGGYRVTITDAQGVKTFDVMNGKDGKNGENGTMSFEELTDEQKATLKGDDGLTPYIGENGHWWIDEVDTGIIADGKDGVSPTLSSKQTENGVEIEITDVNGTKKVELLNGTKGDTGNSGVYMGETEPTDPDVNVWINPDGEAVEYQEKLIAGNNITIRNNVISAIGGSSGEGGSVDLSGYATLDDLSNKVDKVTGKSLIADAEIERLKNVTNYDDTEIKQDLTEINQELNNKADKSDIPDISNLASKNDIPKLVTLTQVEYDALVSAGTVDDNTYYFIKEE